MKLILRADVDNLGRLGDIVEVKNGYGRNFLLPQGLAMPATTASLKAFELERKKLQTRMDALRGEAGALGAKLEAEALVIRMRVGENDKLYGSVTTHMIAEALEAKSLIVDRRRVLLDSPIRALGNYQVRIRLHADVVANLALTVAAEERANMEEKVSNEPKASAPEATASEEANAE